MFTQIKNITLSLLILLIGLGQPLAEGFDLSTINEIEVAEKEGEVKEAEFFSNEDEEKASKINCFKLEVKEPIHIPNCYSQSVFISSQKHTLYLLYDTWLV